MRDFVHTINNTYQRHQTYILGNFTNIEEDYFKPIKICSVMVYISLFLFFIM